MENPSSRGREGVKGVREAGACRWLVLGAKRVFSLDPAQRRTGVPPVETTHLKTVRRRIGPDVLPPPAAAPAAKKMGGGRLIILNGSQMAYDADHPGPMPAALRLKVPFKLDVQPAHIPTSTPFEPGLPVQSQHPSCRVVSPSVSWSGPGFLAVSELEMC